MKYISPSTKETAFNCAHCGALAAQEWHSLSASKVSHTSNLPNMDFFNSDVHFIELDEYLVNPKLLKNLNISSCFNCRKISVWVYDRLAYPQLGGVPTPNPDLSDDIRRDYNEAGSILDASPRGAAALMRLAIQKLCVELGQPGKNIHDDIGALVRGGLNPNVQKALDVVRVIGNSAVHPGQIDMRDDRATAESLFGLLNFIVDKTISEPKHIAEIYKTLPEGVLDGIEKRDKKLN